ncbi:unnamed protein product [Phaedon cochleariae]|uniref:C3H1-type domain-containing protein n=1 Tax=Phaedon cochleariae TaxID=80249 RepID=A0A9P0GVQ6_PHACE|nr:unnamed protein product [Phaedon cochleariae]
MPAENYYCTDNFFKKMTDLDSPKKNNDCYFYYYSTCAKGDNCTFRHEPSALGCETMCSFWKEGKCLNVQCNFRHMELRKNRKAIPCYWESQPMGCLKSHCPFMHQNPRPSDSNSISISSESPEINNQNERKVTAVDSLVVNFEEESDNESGPTFSPNKNRIVTEKTMEEIKLEKIQAESAAYYSYYDQDPYPSETPEHTVDDMRLRIFNRMLTNNSMPERIVTLPQSFRPNTRPTQTTSMKRLSDDQLANILGDESLRKKQKIVFKDDDGRVKVTLNNKSIPPSRPLVTMANNPRSRIPKPRHQHTKQLPTIQPSIANIKIKTLAEIRAEKQKLASTQERMEQEVTSTCSEENLQEHREKTKRRIKLLRKFPVSSASSASVDETTISGSDENALLQMDQWDGESVSSKTIDERLLLEEDDDEDNVTLKAEEELLNEIDDYLDD